MCPPWYRDFQQEDLPVFTTQEDVRVTVIAGESHGVTGAVTRQGTQPVYLDIHLPAGAAFGQALPASHNAFLYVYRGDVTVAGSRVPAQRMAILANDPTADGIVMEASVDSKVLLIAGQPLNEPIVQYGPFVMNAEADIHQAIRDFREGRLA
jgi:redox-sensitive bicupin YhaK (pirin superfamily)